MSGRDVELSEKNPDVRRRTRCPWGSGPNLAVWVFTAAAGFLPSALRDWLFSVRSLGLCPAPAVAKSSGFLNSIQTGEIMNEKALKISCTNQGL